MVGPQLGAQAGASFGAHLGAKAGRGIGVEDFGSFGKDLAGIIARLGLSEELVLALDAGSADSYPGDGQTWYDLAGKGNHFVRGGGLAVDSADTTFNGAAGGLSENEYFSFDGSDWFVESQAHTFAESWHKDGAQFTYLVVLKAPSNSVHHVFCSASLSPGGTGMLLRVRSTPIYIEYVDGGGSNGTTSNPTTIASDTFSVFAWAMNEPASTMTFHINKAAQAASAQYSSPASGDSNSPYRIGARGDGTQSFLSGSRLYAVAAWNRTLKTAEIHDFYDAVKSARFLSLP